MGNLLKAELHTKKLDRFRAIPTNVAAPARHESVAHKSCSLRELWSDHFVGGDMGRVARGRAFSRRLLQNYEAARQWPRPTPDTSGLWRSPQR